MIIGVVQLLNKHGGPFPREDEEKVEQLAHEVAIALEATTLYRELARGTIGPSEVAAAVILSSAQ